MKPKRDWLIILVKKEDARTTARFIMKNLGKEELTFGSNDFGGVRIWVLWETEKQITKLIRGFQTRAAMFPPSEDAAKVFLIDRKGTLGEF